MFPRPWLRAAALLPAALSPVAVQAQATDPAAQAIAAYDDGVIAIMKSGAAMPVRVQRFETLVRERYDMATIAALVVGPKWATTGAADRATAVAALTRHSAVSLARNFKSWGGERFVVDPAVQSRGGSKVVKVTIGSDVLLYRMGLVGGQWRIVDVIAGGVSQLAVQRADLAAIVAAGGVAGLAKRLAEVDAKAK